MSVVEKIKKGNMLAGKERKSNSERDVAVREMFRYRQWLVQAHSAGIQNTAAEIIQCCWKSHKLHETRRAAEGGSMKRRTSVQSSVTFMLQVSRKYRKFRHEVSKSEESPLHARNAHARQEAKAEAEKRASLPAPHHHSRAHARNKATKCLV